MHFVSTLRIPTLAAGLAAALFASLIPSRASAEAMLLIEADTGKVLHAENATYPWYPASVTKLMTLYISLQAVKSGRLTLDKLMPMSARAAAQAPSKMGFKAGTSVTLDNALKMLMVKSANDIAFLIAEGVSGSVEKFADEMNTASQRLGMTQSTWANPNGLPAENQISSARDLAMLARALYREFPEYELYWHIPAIKFGKRTMRNTNALIGRYQGADGMKTGFICASGFNLVASANRNGKRLIAVVLGAPSSPVRAAKAAGMLERGFDRGVLSWLTPSLGTVDSLQPINAAPPDLREDMCGKHRKRPAAEDADDEPVAANGNGTEPGSPQGFMLSSLPPSNGKHSNLVAPPGPINNPIVVHVGAGKTPADAQFASARAKLGKSRLAKGNSDAVRDAHVTPVALTTTASAAPAAVAAAPKPPEPVPTQAVTASIAQPGAFAPPADKFATRGPRVLPAVSDNNNAPWMSFAPAARAAEASPLTAVPGATPEPQVAAVPMPRPRPKVAKPKR